MKTTFESAIQNAIDALTPPRNTEERDALAGLESAKINIGRAMKKSEEAIRQLCGTVNNYSNQLGLGNKVNADDWIELSVGLAGAPR